MILDQATLRDLEIFETAGAGPGVFHLFDRTLTSLGSAALRARFRSPLSDAETIRAHHRAQAFIKEHGLRFFTDEPHVDAVVRYLDSNIQTPRGRNAVGLAIERGWLWLRYRDVFRELEAGVGATAQLIRAMEGFFDRCDDRGPPPLLDGLARRTREVLSDPALRRAVSARSVSPGYVLGSDRTFRSTHASQVRALLEVMAELDMLFSMRQSADELGLTYPEVLDSDDFILDGEGLYHPFVDDPIPNGLRLVSGETLVFLTGPNAAGKTTYLKTAAIALLLAQTGMAVPAHRLGFVPVDYVFTSINNQDDLRAGLSYFMAEVRRVKEAAEILAGGRRALVIFDEVFKGTNVRDALEASELVIRGFSRAGRSGFIFASHLTELASTLEGEPAVRFACFDGRINEGIASYSYALREGVSEQRFGLHLLDRERVPELLAQIAE